MFARLLRLRAGPEIEVGIAIPVGCLVPLAAMLGLAIALAVGVVLATRPQATPVPGQSVLVRVIDDGAPGEPAVLATAIVPLR